MRKNRKIKTSSVYIFSAYVYIYIYRRLMCFNSYCQHVLDEIGANDEIKTRGKRNFENEILEILFKF